MKVGAGIHTLHTADWERVEARDWSRPPAVPDHVALDQTLELGELVEPLGFDCLWASEHFGSPYGMVPNVLQWLTYWAARTEKIDVGSIVVVVPWWNPIRLAHEVAMLDILLRGREFKMGVGRGIAPDEYGALGVPQTESRERFRETIEILKLGLTRERFSYDGEIFKIPETSIRPGPRHHDIGEKIRCAFNTPESMVMAAELGFGQLFVPATPVEEIRKNVIKYNSIRATSGLAPDQPTIYLWGYCVPKQSDIEKGVGYFRRYQGEAATHYGFGDLGRFAKIKGYESYADFSKTLGGIGAPSYDNAFDDPFLASQAIGTPEQIIARVERLQKMTGVKEIMLVFNYGGMPHEESLASMKLFAKEVLPVLKRMPTPMMLEQGAPAGDPASATAK
jgi:alkanesulfonate monooxygenase SsuD/methylene tetrahydromethanopterin reductase-like flavin-dependent oxidoreductase (luciferase family)